MAKKKIKCCCSCCTTAVKVVAFAIVGIAFAAIGGVLWSKNWFSKTVFKNMVQKNTIIKEYVKLKNGSQSYDFWHKPTSPIYMNYYFFHLNNKDEVMAGAKPNVTQKGPYVYRELRKNDPVQWSDNGNELTYLQYKWYYFQPNLSCFNCTPNDEILTVNIPLMTLANMTKYLSGMEAKFARVGLQLVMTTEKATLFHKLKVKEILWGYRDTLITGLKKTKYKGEALLLKSMLNISVADINPFIQLQYNGTNEANMIGKLSIYTGLDNVDKVQDTYSWKGQRIMSYWKNPNGTTYGNMVNGSDGSHFKPFLKSDDVIYIFIPDICRSLYLNYDSNFTLKGINLLRFTTSDLLFMNASSNKANLPFCVPKCFKTGLLSIGQCLPLTLPLNPPVFMSAPHFYQGDPSLVDDIIGLHPEKQKHATFISVEPLTGITMKAYKRIQANLMVEQIDDFTVFSNIRSMVYPIMYMEESAIISDADVAKFNKQMYTRTAIIKVINIDYIKYGLFGIGALFIILSLIIGICGRMRRRTVSISPEREGLIQESDNPYII